MSNQGVNKGRRQFLVAATSAVGAAGVVGVAVPFVASWNPSAKAKAAGAPVKADISKFEPGQLIVVEWRGKPVDVVAAPRKRWQRWPRWKTSCVTPSRPSRCSRPMWIRSSARSNPSTWCAEKNGYDAVIIGCYCDPGLREARGVVDIPVIGLSEASMSFAQMAGGRFAVVTVWESYVPIMEKNLRLYGWEDRAISLRPIRYFNMDWSKFMKAVEGEDRAILADFEEVAMSCIEDGADIIIVGCGYLGPLLSRLNYRTVKGTKVPVIDCALAGVLMAESMARLHRVTGLTPSRHKTSPYPRPPAKKLSAIRKRFGFEFE